MMLASLATLTLATPFISDVSIMAQAAFTEDVINNDVSIKEVGDVRIAETQDGDVMYRSTFNDSARTAVFETIDVNTGEVIDTVFIDLGEKVSDSENSRATIKENTFSNYEYTITTGSPNKWQIRRWKSLTSTYYYNVTETSKNKTYLNNFKKHVDDINTKEFAILGSITASLLTDIIAIASGVGNVLVGGSLTVAQWQAVLASAGAKAALVTSFTSWQTSVKNAYFQYWEVINNS